MCHVTAILRVRLCRKGEAVKESLMEMPFAVAGGVDEGVAGPSLPSEFTPLRRSLVCPSPADGHVENVPRGERFHVLHIHSTGARLLPSRLGEITCPLARGSAGASPSRGTGSPPNQPIGDSLASAHNSGGSLTLAQSSNSMPERVFPKLTGSKVELIST